MSYHLTWASVILVGVGTPLARAQHAEEHETETVGVPAVPDTSGKRPDLAATAKAITDQTNAFRKKEGRGPVAVNEKLTATAEYFAGYMARTDEYGHHADGADPGERVKKHGYRYCIVAENIAYAFNSQGFDTGPLADQFAAGWEKSPPHRKNMLDPDVTETGVAVARSEKTGHYYAVQLFGRPKSAAIVFKVENRSGEAVTYTIVDRTFDLAPRVVRTHTRCRPSELTFTLPGGKTATAKPTTGDHLVVTKGTDGLAVTKE